MYEQDNYPISFLKKSSTFDCELIKLKNQKPANFFGDKQSLF